MTIYTDLAATATTLLTEYGQTVTFTRATGRSVDPVTGVVTPGTPAALVAKGILRRYPDALVDGTRITASDRELVIDASVTPAMSDLVTIAGQQWTVVGIDSSNPAGTPLVYFVQVRR